MHVKKTISADEFWQFSLQYYALNNNQTLLLWLQDNAGLNVNVVLLLMYLRTKSANISFNKFNDLNRINKNLDSLTSNYRKKRRALKVVNIANGITDYRCKEYQVLLNQELDLEKQQQSNLIEAALDFFGDDLKYRESVNMDIKHYLLASVICKENDDINKLENVLDELLDEQKKLAVAYGTL